MNARQKPGRRQRRREATRERIFRAALRLFAERGALATTVEDITEAADVGKGTFFNYFQSKEHLLAAFGQMQMEKARTVLGEAGRGEPLRELMRRLVRVLAEEPGRSPALVRGILAGHLSNEAVRRLLRRNLARGLRLLTGVVAAGQQRGEIRFDHPPAIIARSFMQAYFGALLMWTIFPSDPLAARLDSTFDLTWSGIEPREAPEARQPRGRKRA